MSAPPGPFSTVERQALEIAGVSAVVAGGADCLCIVKRRGSRNILAAARDPAREKIRVVTIAPGIFWTPMLPGLPQAAQDSLGMQVPHPSRLGRPEEYAQFAKAITGNPMLNGETIRLDDAIRTAPR